MQERIRAAVLLTEGRHGLPEYWAWIAGRLESIAGILGGNFSDGKSAKRTSDEYPGEVDAEALETFQINDWKRYFAKTKVRYIFSRI